MERERLGSRLGFLLLSAGCAIGIGNVWKFPYMCGQYGGGAFVLVYAFFLVVMGVPVMTMEFAMGRASRKSPVRLYEKLAPNGSKWHIHGYFAMAGNYILMMFYTTVCGWMVQYFVQMAKGTFVGKDAEGVANVFKEMLADPVTLTIYMVVVVVLGFAVNSIGLQNGLEKVTKVMMLALMAIMVVLVLFSISYASSCSISLGQSTYETPWLLWVADALFAIFSVVALRNSRQMFILNMLMFTIVFMVVGVMGYGWYLPEICALFLSMAIAAGISAGYSSDRIAKEFIAGYQQTSYLLPQDERAISKYDRDSLHYVNEESGGKYTIETCKAFTTSYWMGRYFGVLEEGGNK